MKDLILKSAAASVLIAIGDYVLLTLGNPLGPFLFALGLLGVCVMGLNLFTGKCGFLFEDKLKIGDLLLILLVNLIAGYLMGLLFSFCSEALVSAAVGKVESWDISLSFVIRSFMCGVIMYIAVYIYRKGSPLGVLIGVPVFIFCSFQHCIANVITLGIARTFDWSLPVCVLGNFAGSLFIWYLSKTTKKVQA